MIVSLKLCLNWQYLSCTDEKSFWNFTMSPVLGENHMCDTFFMLNCPFQPYEHPVRTNQIPRQVPEQAWFMSPLPRYGYLEYLVPL